MIPYRQMTNHHQPNPNMFPSISFWGNCVQQCDHNLWKWEGREFVVIPDTTALPLPLPPPKSLRLLAHRRGSQSTPLNLAILRNTLSSHCVCKLLPRMGKIQKRIKRKKRNKKKKNNPSLLLQTFNFNFIFFSCGSIIIILF